MASRLSADVVEIDFDLFSSIMDWFVVEVFDYLRLSKFEPETPYESSKKGKKIFLIKYILFISLIIYFIKPSKLCLLNKYSKIPI